MKRPICLQTACKIFIYKINSSFAKIFLYRIDNNDYFCKMTSRRKSREIETNSSHFDSYT